MNHAEEMKENMHRHTISLCIALAWATSNLACAGDDGDETDGLSTGIETGTGAQGTGAQGTVDPTNGASDPGNSGVSSAGDGVDTDDAIWGSVDLYVAAGAGVAGLEPGTNVENTVDGWTVRYDRLIVTVGSFDAYTLSGDELALGHPAGLVIDLRQAAAPQRLHGKNVTTREFGDFSFKLPGASAASRLVEPATDADYDLMVKGGYSIYMEGTLTHPAGQSCSPEDPKDCTPAPMLTFKWGMASATEFSGCPGFTVEPGGDTDVTLTIPGDHWFRGDFRPDGLLPRRAQWIANADLDRNGETTLEELKMIKASLLFTPELDYDLAGAPIPVDTAHDFLEAQVRTLGLNTATGCQAARAL